MGGTSERLINSQYESAIISSSIPGSESEISSWRFPHSSFNILMLVILLISTNYFCENSANSDQRPKFRFSEKNLLISRNYLIHRIISQYQTILLQKCHLLNNQIKPSTVIEVEC